MREDINLTINTLQKSSKVKEWREELREAVKDLLTNSPRIRVSVSSDMQKKIANVGTLASYSRSPVVRYGYGSREIIDICDREIGTRISNELMMTGVGLAMLRSDSEVSDEDLKFLIKSALDSMPKTRRCVLRSLCEGGASSCAEVSRSVRLPETTVRYLLQDLQAVKLVVSDNFWDISDDCRILIESTGFSDPRELWWTYDSAL